MAIREERSGVASEILNSIKNFKNWLIKSKEQIDGLNYFSSDNDQEYWDRKFNREIDDLDGLIKEIEKSAKDPKNSRDLDAILENVSREGNEIEYSSRTLLTNYAREVIQNDFQYILSMKDKGVYAKLPDIRSKAVEDLFFGDEDASYLNEIRTENPRDMIALLEEVNEIMEENGLLKEKGQKFNRSKSDKFGYVPNDDFDIDNLDIALPRLSRLYGISDAGEGDEKNAPQDDYKHRNVKQFRGNKFGDDKVRGGFNKFN